VLTGKLSKSPDAGFKATFPCEPASTKKLFQKEPKIANLYSYKCDHQGISFSISLPERFEDFDSSRIEQDLSGVEQTLRSMIGDKAQVVSKNRVVKTHSSREFEVDGGGTYGRQLNIAHPRGVYGVQAFGKYANKAGRSEIESLAQRFLDSFTFL